MKYSILCIISCCMVTSLFGQEKVNPVIKSYGGIYAITEATLNVDSELPYTIVVDVMTGSEEKSKVAWGLNNVARMLNLHAVSGADVTKMDVVLAIHGPVTLALLNNEAFQKRFGMENPNVPLLKELKAAGVTLTVCGQSMM
ncbi:MAG: DsrE family protein, partial [Cyclobacteriaceae bacterium]|nr:DsrE family protein [Cyclobacteriaceae bacterium]